jgi:hypothetical protein
MELKKYDIIQMIGQKKYDEELEVLKKIQKE